MPYYYGLLAEVLDRRGEFDEAFSLIDEAKEFMNEYEVRFSRLKSTGRRES